MTAQLIDGKAMAAELRAELRAEVAESLARSGFVVEAVADCAEAEAALAATTIDVVILGEPGDGGDPLLFCRRIVEEANARVIIVSRHLEERDRVLGLEFGAVHDAVPTWIVNHRHCRETRSNRPVAAINVMPGSSHCRTDPRRHR